MKRDRARIVRLSGYQQAFAVFAFEMPGMTQSLENNNHWMVVFNTPPETVTVSSTSIIMQQSS